MSGSSDAGRAALLDARSTALARRNGERASAQAGQAYLVCVSGDGRYGLPLKDVAAVIGGRPCTPVPGAPPALAGIVALSGTIVSVIDLARALGSDGGARVEQGHLVRLRVADPPVALAVERVVGIVQVASSSETEPGAGDLAGFGAGLVSSYAAPGLDTAAAEGGFSIVDLPGLLRRLTA